MQTKKECKHKDFKTIPVKEAVICKKCGEVIGYMTKTFGEGIKSRKIK